MKYLSTILVAICLSCATLTDVSAQAHISHVSAASEEDSAAALAESKTLKLQWDRGNYLYERSMQEYSKLFLMPLVVIYYENGVLTKQSGSASLVKNIRNHRTYFLSNEHIFTDDDEKPLLQDFTAILTVGKNRFYFPKRDIFIRHDPDIMIIKAPDNLRTDLLLDEGLKLNRGNVVTIFGYPDGDFLASKGVVLCADEDFSILDAAIYGGSSGGPMVLVGKQKKLAGIIKSFTYNNMTGASFIPLREIAANIKEFDKLHNIK